jgi:hypothetical protein
MAVTIDASVGDTASNSYLTLAEADAYHETHLYSDDWDGSDDATKNVALVMATRLMDSMFEWAAFPSDEDQALQWPRSGVMAANKLELVADDEIPQELKNATAELARQLISGDRTADSDIESLGITSLSAGPVSLAFKATQQVKVIPDAVTFLLPNWWYTVRNRKMGIRTLMRA